MPAPVKKIKTKTIRQSTIFACKPAAVYDALMDSQKHAQFTRHKATISPKVGGKFTTYDGYADGKTIELVPNKKIVQTWHASDWPKGHYSEISFELSPLKNGTKLVFVQKELPVEFAKDIAQGWKDYYWKPMKKMLEK